MKKLDQKGFTHFEMALLVLVLAAIGFAGYTVWQKNKPDSQPQSSSQVTKKESQQAEDKKDEVQSDTARKTTTQYVNGVSFELPNSIGNLLTYNLTQQNVNLSSEALLAKEKELYGDAELQCQANSFALGRISVKDESTPDPGFALVKKMGSGKYLYYQDDSRSSNCYILRDKLHSLIDSQVSDIKSALKEAK